MLDEKKKMGNPGEDDETLPPVINKVLCCTSTARHSMRHDDIVGIYLNLYKEGEILKAKFIGPYRVDRKIYDVNYAIAAPVRRQNKRMSHISMMKPYNTRARK